LLLLVLVVPAAHANAPLAQGIQDNSCLSEEAWKQEAGHEQHIINLPRQEAVWQFNFSQAWPMANQIEADGPFEAARKIRRTMKSFLPISKGRE